VRREYEIMFGQKLLFWRSSRRIANVNVARTIFERVLSCDVDWRPGAHDRAH